MTEFCIELKTGMKRKRILDVTIITLKEAFFKKKKRMFVSKSLIIISNNFLEILI